MRVKVCGMKYEENIEALAQLGPDYMGLIFYEDSPRNYNRDSISIADSIDKIGVFVNETLDKVVAKVSQFDLKGVQLHGDEDPEYCRSLKEAMSGKEDKLLIKAFSVGEELDWNKLKKYDTVCDYFLFDTKGKNPGGNGEQFNWKLLSSYPFEKPFFLSGGIGPEDLESVKAFIKTKTGGYCHALDVNSGFEESPGLKNIVSLRKFLNEVKQ